MKRRSYKEYNNEENSKKTYEFGEHGLLYSFEDYFILINEQNISYSWVIISRAFKDFLIFQGKCILTVKSGSVCINGIKYQKGFTQEIYSPLSHSRMSLSIPDSAAGEDIDTFLKNVFHDSQNSDEDINFLKSLNELQMSKIFKGETTQYVFLKLDTLFCITLNDIVQFKDFRRLFEVDLNFPFACKLQYSLTMSKSPSYVLTDDMIYAMDKIIAYQKSDSVKLAIVGPKNSGKSSLMKIAVNKLLSEGINKVFVLDGDPGQTEFSTAGCVSLTMVTSPLLGPPFTHQLSSSRINIIEQYYIGSVSPVDDPKLYCRSVERLFQVFLALHKSCNVSPLVINTMGWTKGLGVDLMMFKILMMQPSHIFQLKKGRPDSDLPDLTLEYFRDYKGSETLLSRLPRIVSSVISVIKSPPENNNKQTILLSPHNHRDLTMLVYLFQQTVNRPLYLPNSYLPSDYIENPVTRLRCRIPMFLKYTSADSSIGEYSNGSPIVCMQVAHSSNCIADQLDFVVDTFSIQWVAVCRRPPDINYISFIPDSLYCDDQADSRLMQCIGSGLVSHVRKENCEIDLLTGLDNSALHGCCLVKGRVSAPDCLFLNQAEVSPQYSYLFVPFVSPQVGIGSGRTPTVLRKSLPKVRRHQHS